MKDRMKDLQQFQLQDLNTNERITAPIQTPHYVVKSNNMIGASRGSSSDTLVDEPLQTLPTRIKELGRTQTLRAGPFNALPSATLSTTSSKNPKVPLAQRSKTLQHDTKRTSEVYEILQPRVVLGGAVSVEMCEMDETDRILVQVDSIAQAVASLRCQSARLRGTLSEFETHGEGEDVSLLRQVLEEKGRILKDGLRGVKGRVAGLVVKGGGTAGVVQLAAFHRRRLGVEVADVETELAKVLKDGGGFANGRMNEVAAAGFTGAGAGEFLRVDHSFENGTQGKRSNRLQDLIDARVQLDDNQAQEHELKRIEGGLTELVSLYGDMRNVIDMQDAKMDVIVTSLDETCIEVEAAAMHVTEAVRHRHRSRRTCWISAAWISGLVALVIVGAVVYFRVIVAH
ncbi:hypothetical protein BC830DRAFT_1125952 [Chytriomyces sp. MP71]|nr:hypothetical protein BC830DRAFT_1125952 [Chytriomyces sp. MP71]